MQCSGVLPGEFSFHVSGQVPYLKHMENVLITKLFAGGVEDKKAKQVPVPCFAMDVDRGRTFIGGGGIAPSGTRTAFALTDEGRRVLPDLHRAEVVGFFADGFRVSGFCEEVVGGKARRVYSEWFVFYGSKKG